MNDKYRTNQTAPPALLVVVFIIGTGIAVGVASPYALLTVILDGLKALVVLAGPVLAGLWLVPGFRLGSLPLRWHLLIGAALGIGATSLLILLLGLAGALQRPVWIVIQVTLVAAGLVRLQALLGAKRRNEKSNSRRVDETSGATGYLWFLAGPFLVLGLIAASNAPGFIWQEEGFGYDALEYHLEMPKEYLHAGSIEYAPHNVYANFPANIEMLYLLAMILLKEDVDVGTVANMIHLILAMLTVYGAWLAGREWSPRAGVVSAVVMASAGWLAYLCGLAYVENGMLFFTVTAIAVLLNGAQASDDPPGAVGLSPRGVTPVRWIVLAGVITGLACGCKYSAVPLVALPLAVAVMLLPGRSVQRSVAKACVFTLAALLTFSPWLMKNRIMTGNPVFPHANGVFEASPQGWGPQESERWDRGHMLAPDEDTLLQRLSIAWNRIPGDRYQRFGPLIILLPVGGLLFRKRDRVDLILLIMLLLQLGVWLLATHLYARFAVVMLVPLALLAGRAVAGGIGRTRVRAIAVALIVGSGWNLAFAVRHQRLESSGGAPASLVYDGMLAGYEYFKVINHELPEDAKILLVGDARAFYFQREVDYCVVFNKNPFVEAVRSAGGNMDGDIVGWLRDQGYTHVLVNWNEVSRLSNTYGFAPEITPALFERLASHGLSMMHDFPHPTHDGRYTTLYAVR